MKFTATSQIDYMHFNCDECESRIVTTLLGYDPAVPRFRFECTGCDASGEYKMEFNKWHGLPQEPASH